MGKSWFHLQGEFKYGCRLSKSMDSLGPIENTSVENTSVNEDPARNDMDKNIHAWSHCYTYYCYTYYSKIDHLFGVKDIRKFISDSDATFLIGIRGTRNPEGIDNDHSFLSELESFFYRCCISIPRNNGSKNDDPHYDFHLYDINYSWNNQVKGSIHSFLSSKICRDSAILSGSDKYNAISNSICGEGGNSSEGENAISNSICGEGGNSSEGENFNFNIRTHGNDNDLTLKESSNNSKNLNLYSKNLDLYKSLWVQCENENCYGLNYKKFLKSQMNMCEHCGYHFKMNNSSDRIELLIDPGTWSPMDEDMISLDPSQFLSDEDEEELSYFDEDEDEEGLSYFNEDEDKERLSYFDEDEDKERLSYLLNEIEEKLDALRRADSDEGEPSDSDSDSDEEEESSYEDEGEEEPSYSDEGEEEPSYSDEGEEEPSYSDEGEEEESSYSDEDEEELSYSDEDEEGFSYFDEDEDKERLFYLLNELHEALAPWGRADSDGGENKENKERLYFFVGEILAALCRADSDEGEPSDSDSDSDEDEEELSYFDEDEEESSFDEDEEGFSYFDEDEDEEGFSYFDEDEDEEEFSYFDEDEDEEEFSYFDEDEDEEEFSYFDEDEEEFAALRRADSDEGENKENKERFYFFVGEILAALCRADSDEGEPSDSDSDSDEGEEEEEPSYSDEGDEEESSFDEDEEELAALRRTDSDEDENKKRLSYLLNKIEEELDALRRADSDEGEKEEEPSYEDEGEKEEEPSYEDEGEKEEEPSYEDEGEEEPSDSDEDENKKRLSYLAKEIEEKLDAFSRAYSDKGEKEEEPSYEDYIDSYQRKTGLTEAIQTGTGRLKGIRIAIGVMDFHFIGGSMGSVVGEKITRLIEYASNHFLPLILVCASGGARMQEGSLSLMQMAKISSALYDYQLNKKLFYVAILTSPTTGGVTASFGMLGDIIIAEPNALIAFAGKRIIEQLLHITVPEGFQETENLFDKGLFDLILPRNRLKDVLSELLQLHGFFPWIQN